MLFCSYKNVVVSVEQQTTTKLSPSDNSINPFKQKCGNSQLCQVEVFGGVITERRGEKKNCKNNSVF